MKIRAKIQTPYRTIISNKEMIDIPFLQEILDNLMEIESLNTLDADGSHQNFILKGSSSKKLKDLKSQIELAFKK